MTECDPDYRHFCEIMAEQNAGTAKSQATANHVALEASKGGQNA
jgi:hypothetical protein